MKNGKKSMVAILVFVMAFSIMGGMEGGQNYIPEQVYADTTVYVTRTGSKYHSHKCGNGTYYKSTLSQAQARGLQPCTKCYGSDQPSTGSGSSSGKKKKIQLNTTSKVLIVGQSFQLKLRNTKAKPKWKSSNKKIAKVSKKGKVVARKKGKATIAAYLKGKKYKCKVKVEDPKLSATAITMYEGEETELTLKGCSHTQDWETSDYEVVDFDEESDNLYAQSAGTAVITVKVHGKKFRCNVTVLEKEDGNLDDEEDDSDDWDDDWE